MRYLVYKKNLPRDVLVILQVLCHMRDDVIFDQLKAGLDDDGGVDNVVTEIFAVGALSRNIFIGNVS